jgi:gliding motility-associated-like protein
MNRYILLICLTFLFLNVKGQYLDISQPEPYGNGTLLACAGTNAVFKLNRVQNMNAGSVITLLLSDANGNFSPGTTLSTVKYSLNNSSWTNGYFIVSGGGMDIAPLYLTVKIPAGSPSGTGYKVRVQSTNPVMQGGNNNGNITINTPPAAPSLSTSPPYDQFGNGRWIAQTFSWSPVNSGVIDQTNVGSEAFFDPNNYLGYFDFTNISFDLNYGNPSVFPGPSSYYTNTNLCPRSTNYAIRFQRTNFPAGTYNFTVNADDGIRLNVNGTTLTNADQYIQKGYDALGGSTKYSAPASTGDICLTPNDKVVVEYFQRPAASRSTLTYTFVPTSVITVNGPGDQGGCGPATFSVSVTQPGTYTYQWYESTDNFVTSNVLLVDNSIYGGSTTSSLTITGATQSMDQRKYRCVVTGTNCSGSGMSSAGTLTISTTPTFTRQPTDLPICIGQNASFSVAVSRPGYPLQWMVSTDGGTTFTNIQDVPPYSGATTLTLSIASVPVGFNSYLYKAIINQGFPCFVPSTPAMLTVNNPPDILGSNSSICSGSTSSVGLSSTTSGTSFSWTTATSGSTITGASASSGNTISQTLTNTGRVNGIVTYSITATSPSRCTNTRNIDITVFPPTTPGTISASQTVCPGDAIAPLTGSVPTGGDGNYSYAWEKSLNNSTWTAIGVTTIGYTPASVTSTTYFRRTDTFGRCGSSTTNVVTITIGSNLTAGTIGNSQPNVCYNTAPNALVELSAPSGGGGAYNFMWQSSPNDADPWTDLGVTNQTTYQPGPLTSTLFIRRKVSLTTGTCPPVYSNSVMLKNGNSTPGTIGNTQSICINTAPSQLIQLTPPTNTPAPYTFQWEMSSDNIVFTDIPSETNSSFNPPILTAPVYYRRNLTGSICGILSSPSVAITINTASNPNVQLSSSAPICQGSSFTYTATATNAGTAPTYLWTINGNPAGTNSNTLTSSNFNNNDVVKITIYSSLLCSPLPASAMATAIVQPPVTPSVVIQDPGLICASNFRTFTPTETYGGPAPRFEWRVNGINIFTGPVFSSSSLSNGDIVEVNMTSSNTCVTSQTALSNAEIVKINTLPKVTIIPPYLTVCEGTQATFQATHIEGATYSWTLNGVEKETTESFTTTIGGTYIVTVRKGCEDTSKTLLTTAPKIIVNAGAPVLICKGEPVILTANAPNATTFKWNLEKSGNSITVNPIVTTLYTVTASNSYCEASDTVRVSIKNAEQHTLYIPNSFTPNGDGKNDEFKISGEGILEMQGTIYNRWGEMIYQWTNIEGGWEGPLKTQGDPTMNDVFVYSIKVKNICDVNFSKHSSGIVTILK